MMNHLQAVTIIVQMANDHVEDRIAVIGETDVQEEAPVQALVVVSIARNATVNQELRIGG